MAVPRKQEFVLDDGKEHLGAGPESETVYTPTQLDIQREGKRMVGGVLTIVEAAIPPGKQLDSTKRLIQEKMYDGLKAILRVLNETSPI